MTLRILVINYEYPPIGGGGGLVTRDILEEMAKRGHRVTIVTSHFGELPKREVKNDVHIIRVPVFFRKEIEVANMASMLFYPLISTLEVLTKRLSCKYDIINTHFALPSGPAGYFISKVAGVPNVLSIHGGDIYDPSKTTSPHKAPVFLQTVRAMLKTADRIVAQSSDTKNNAYRFYKINRPIDVIPLGIKKPEYIRKARADFGLNSKDIVFCTIGRLIKRKNLGDALAVLAGVPPEIPAKLLIIGDGPERAHLEQLTHRLSLSEKVQFLGNTSDELKFQALDVADCYLSTALHEGFGLVFLEAMECGLPIISYDRGGHNDFLTSGKTGFLIEVGNKEAFNRRVNDIIEDKELRQRISSHNRQFIKNFYIDKCADKYLALFEEVLRNRYCTAP